MKIRTLFLVVTIITSSCAVASQIVAPNIERHHEPVVPMIVLVQPDSTR